MKFLFVANTHPDPNQGASGCDLNTIKALRNLGHEVDDIWTGSFSRLIRHNNLHQLLELPGLFRNVVLNRCGKKDYDVVHVNQPHAWLAAKAHREHQLPGVFINRSHGWESRAWEKIARIEADNRPLVRRLATASLRPLLARHNRLVAKWADGIVVETSGDQKAASSEGAKQVLVLEPGIPEPFLSSNPIDRADRHRRILHAGSFSPHKSPEVAASVFRQLAAAGHFSLTWITQESAHPQVRRLLGEAAEKVDLRDWVPLPMLRELMDTHGFFLQPSVFEGFSLTFLQAMARRCCVLGTKIDCMMSTIEHGVNGYLFEPGEASAMAATVMETDPDQWKTVGAAAQERARTFTWTRTATKLVDFCGFLEKTKQR